MKQRVWFEREFALGMGSEAFPEVVSRVAGAPARLEELVRNADPARLVMRWGSKWSAQEHVGHLGDLEPLWSGRLEDLITGEACLRPADLQNRATDAANHDEAAVDELLRRFRQARTSAVTRLETLTATDLAKTALHPRLEQPMSVVDLFFFVAEHDDHHLAAVSRLLRGPVDSVDPVV